MTVAQRTATLEMCAAILRCDCAPPDIRVRARTLQMQVALQGALGAIWNR